MINTLRRTRALLAGAAAAPVVVCLAVMAPDPAMAQKPPSEWDGLVRAERKSLEHVYVRPNVEFKAYKRVRLEPVPVRMDKTWDPNGGRIPGAGQLTTSDVQRIRDELSKAFREVFAERLSKRGYPVVEAAGDDVLVVEAALTDVYVTAPAAPTANTRSYVLSAGRMTLVMQLADSVSGQVLARVVDTKASSDTRGAQWANSVSNSAEARRAMTAWADALCKALDTLNGQAGGR